jgi:two-component sensor histidine kinase
MSATVATISTDELTLRLAQQELVARFGLFALEPGPFQRLVDEACRVAALGLGTDLAKVLRYRPTLNDFLVEAGVGWHAGVVGNSTLGSGLDSPAGYAMHTGQPTMSNLLSQEGRFRVPALLAEHGVQSAINVMIEGRDRKPYGVLEVDSTRRHDFVHADTAFLQSLANVLAAGLARVESELAKDALLLDKDLLMREVHHRVKNSLQLVRTMLGLQARGSSDETREQLDMAAGRIMSIAAVHQRLYEGGSVADGDVVAYLDGLLDDMRGMLDDIAGDRAIVLECEALMLSADALTPLGLIVSELVTNALKYGEGRIRVRVERGDMSLNIVVEDEGERFPLEPSRHRGLGMRLIAALARRPAGQAIMVDPSVPFSRVVVNLTL